MNKSFNITTVNSLADLKTVRITGTRSCHCFVPVSEITSSASLLQKILEYKIHFITNLYKLYIAHKIHLTEVINISDHNEDMRPIFYHPVGPWTVFKINEKNQTWVNNVLRKLSGLELTNVLEGHITLLLN